VLNAAERPMNQILRITGNSALIAGIVVLGSALSFVSYQVLQLETRWGIIVLIAAGSIVASMRLSRVFSHFVLIVALFCLPLATFTKWFIPSGFLGDESAALTYSGVFSIGLFDFILAGLYMSWFFRIFIRKTAPLPQLNLIDWLILWFVCAHLFATLGAYSTEAGLGSTEFLVKHVLFYFYISRHIDERHLPWLLAAFAFAIAIDAFLGVIQFTTGKLVGIAYDKGAGGTYLNKQYVVPGLESFSRATGTSYDSHTLGEFVGAIMPFPFVVFFIPRLRLWVRLGSALTFFGAVLVLGLCLSRTGWIASAIAMVAGVLLVLGLWRERLVIPIIAGAVILGALLTPLLGPLIYERFANSPEGTITMRLLEFKDAWNIFTLYPIFGVGPGHFTHVYKDHNPLHLPLGPVHSSVLWLAVESGIIGISAYLTILVNASWRLFALARCRRDLAGRLALASLLGIITIVINDQFNAGFREPNVFMTFWLLIALSVSLPGLAPGSGEFLLEPPPSPYPGAARDLSIAGPKGRRA
jgi:O-antigen ligase